MTALLHRPLHLWMVRHRLLLLGLLVLAGIVVLLAVGRVLGVVGSSTSGESTGVAPAQPQLLPSPVHSSGDGWELDVYVSNLQELDLALVAGLVIEGTPLRARLRLALVDLPSGQTAASGMFGADPRVRLREDPLQLLVSNGGESAERRARVLIFDLDGQDIALAATLELPERSGSRSGFANGMMVLSGDGRYLFVDQFTRVDAPGCAATNYADSDVCTHSNIGVVDLNQPTEVTSVPLPARCATIFSPFGDQSLMVGCRRVAYAIRADDATSDRLTRAYASVDAPAAAEQGPSFFVRFLTQLPNGAMRALRGGGAVLAEPGEVLDDGLLPEGHHVVHVERIDDSRVLIMAGRGQAGSQLITKLLIVDIEGPRVLYSVDAPSGLVNAAPIDDTRAVLLIHDAGAELPSGGTSGGDALSAPNSLDSPGAFVIREFDLTSGELGESIILQGLPSEPSAILSPRS